MACTEITAESIKSMSDNDLGSLFEDCKELGHPLTTAAAVEMLCRFAQPSNNLDGLKLSDCFECGEFREHGHVCNK